MTRDTSCRTLSKFAFFSEGARNCKGGTGCDSGFHRVLLAAGGGQTSGGGEGGSRGREGDRDGPGWGGWEESTGLPQAVPGDRVRSAWLLDMALH